MGALELAVERLDERRVHAQEAAPGAKLGRREELGRGRGRHRARARTVANRVVVRTTDCPDADARARSASQEAAQRGRGQPARKRRSPGAVSRQEAAQRGRGQPARKRRRAGAVSRPGTGAARPCRRPPPARRGRAGACRTRGPAARTGPSCRRALTSWGSSPSRKSRHEAQAALPTRPGRPRTRSAPSPGATCRHRAPRRRCASSFDRDDVVREAVAATRSPRRHDPAAANSCKPASWPAARDERKRSAISRRSDR